MEATTSSRYDDDFIEIERPELTVYLFQALISLLDSPETGILGNAS